MQKYATLCISCQTERSIMGCTKRISCQRKTTPVKCRAKAFCYNNQHCAKNGVIPIKCPQSFFFHFSPQYFSELSSRISLNSFPAFLWTFIQHFSEFFSQHFSDFFPAFLWIVFQHFSVLWSKGKLAQKSCFWPIWSWPLLLLLFAHKWKTNSREKIILE